MTPIDYHCKICGKPGIAYYDPACPMNNLESWRKALCCDRCYDFRDAYLTSRRAIERLCVSLTQVHQMHCADARKEALDAIQERLIHHTKRIASVCSDHYKVQNIWGFEMVRILMDNPAGCNRAIDRFKADYAKI